MQAAVAVILDRIIPAADREAVRAEIFSACSPCISRSAESSDFMKIMIERLLSGVHVLDERHWTQERIDAVSR
jgi:hypothetical protein